MATLKLSIRSRLKLKKVKSVGLGTVFVPPRLSYSVGKKPYYLYTFLFHVRGEKLSFIIFIRFQKKQNIINKRGD